MGEIMKLLITGLCVPNANPLPSTELINILNDIYLWTSYQQICIRLIRSYMIQVYNMLG